jgi:hypothetical protein
LAGRDGSTASGGVKAMRASARAHGRGTAWVALHRIRGWERLWTSIARNRNESSSIISFGQAGRQPEPHLRRPPRFSWAQREFPA